MQTQFNLSSLIEKKTNGLYNGGHRNLSDRLCNTLPQFWIQAEAHFQGHIDIEQRI